MGNLKNNKQEGSLIACYSVLMDGLETGRLSLTAQLNLEIECLYAC